MTPFKRPMLAASLLPAESAHSNAEILLAMERLKYPVLCSLKIDGIRGIKLDNLVSRTLKLIPNKSLRERAMQLPYGYDMELYNPELTYDKVESIVMSREHIDSNKIQFHILDNFNIETGYINRIWSIEKDMKCWSVCPFVFSPPVECPTPERLFETFIDYEAMGAEGICFRLMNSKYKQGRSTLKEQYLVKLCRFQTSEAMIVGFEEQLENVNGMKRNAVGMMDRSSHNDSLIPKNTLGALLVRDLTSHIEFRIGTGVGLDDRLRKEIWMNREKYLGKIATYKYKGGGKIKPRSPIWKGLRKEIDIV